jgi:hypothetical protein
LGLVIAVVALPFLMGLYALYFRAQADFPLFYDIRTNWEAAVRLYAGDGAVYSVPGSYSFPFPTYWLYWLATGLGAWGAAGVFVAFSLLASCAWGMAWVRLWPAIKTLLARAEEQQALILLTLLCVPAAQAIGQGQTATFALLGLVVFGWSLSQPGMIMQALGGLALALAIGIKPQLAFIGVAMLAGRAGYSQSRHRLAMLALVGLAWLALPLLLPGGVDGSHYRLFLSEILPNLTPPTDEFKVHSSPAFVLSVLLLRLGVSEGLASLAATGLTLALLAAFLWRAWVQQWLLYERVMLAAVWAIYAPQQSWNFYLAWGLPAILLILSDIVQRQSWGRWRWLLLGLGLTNIQVAGTPLAALAMSIIAYLVWTYPAQVTPPLSTPEAR